jgi:pimeloyl-CoA dehydrogenase
MNFELNDEQVALADSLQRVLTDHYGFEKRRALAKDPRAHDPAAWSSLAELGVTALPLPEAHGGFGGKAEDLFPVMQAFGRALSLEPFLSSVVLAATAVRLAADEETQARILPGVARGETVLAWAHDEVAGRHAPLWMETRAERRNGKWVLNGAKSPVLCAGLASQVVVSARVSGAPDDADGCALFLIAREAAGVELREFRLVDDTAAGELRMREVIAEALHDPTDAARARRAIDGTLAAGIAAVCADMAGSMQAAFDLAMDYLRTRKQFGRFIGENQALRHRAAEMLVALEMARSMAIAAAIAADEGDSDEARRDLHQAKVSVGRNARLLAHGAIQLHGGIGMTEEYAVGHHLRRIHVLDQMFGDSDAHSARLAALS